MIHPVSFLPVHNHLAIKANKNLNLVSSVRVTNSEYCGIPYAVAVKFLEYQVAQYCLAKELGGNIVGKLLLAEVAREELPCSVQHIEVDDIVIIHIVDSHALVIIRRPYNLVCRRVHLYVAMIAVTAVRNDSIPLYEPVLV